MKCAAIIALACLPTVALAQNSGATWHGLKFGMSEDVVKQTLEKDFQFQPGTKGRYTLTPNVEMKIAGLALTFTFEPLLVFDSNGLNVITLVLDVPKMMADKSSPEPGIIAATGGPAIYEQLIGKYGRPITTEGECEDVPVHMIVRTSTESPSCKASWKGDNQLVSYYWWYNHANRKLFLAVEYKAQSSDL
jgi:hypothetical protein